MENVAVTELSNNFVFVTDVMASNVIMPKKKTFSKSRKVHNEKNQKRSCIGSTMAQGAGEGAGRGQIIVRSHQRFLEGVCQMTTQEKLDIQTLLEWHLKQLHQAEEEGNKTLTAFHDTASNLLWGLTK